jgi:hypothetical protein
MSVVIFRHRRRTAKIVGLNLQGISVASVICSMTSGRRRKFSTVKDVESVGWVDGKATFIATFASVACTFL